MGGMVQTGKGKRNKGAEAVQPINLVDIWVLFSVTHELNTSVPEEINNRIKVIKRMA
ncbi:hypothetical protein C7420_10635 [Pantoea ananatis]|jgi:hypothetical protein|nr:hypothetical protein C7420_10635 [Pantoea ananatis]